MMNFHLLGILKVREGSLSQHSYPTLPQRRTGGRRLPPTPRKPSTLNLGVVGSVVLATQRLPRSPTAPHISGTSARFFSSPWIGVYWFFSFGNARRRRLDGSGRQHQLPEA